MTTPFSRRRFLASMAGAAGTRALPFAATLAAMGNAAAADGDDYKALICVFLTGGNDAYNTVLATDSVSWQQYERYRSGGATSIALPPPGASGGVLPIAPSAPHTGRTFALHPNLGSVKSLFDAGRVGIVANVGTLVAPTTVGAYRSGTATLPRELFSHNDQQSVWQSSMPEGASYGWGGRMGDLLASGNSNNMFTCVSTAGNAVFVSGRNVSQYQVDAAGVKPVLSLDGYLFGTTRHPLRSIITNNGSSNVLEREYVAIVNKALQSQTFLGNAMAPSGGSGIPVPPTYIDPNTRRATVNPLAVQLQTVARVIAARGALGVRRQVFFVSLGGFDTHDNQRTRHADLMARLAHGMAYFDDISANLMGVNMRDKITLFTASDFGRTLVTNGDGTDHGWGGHHFVMGGAVQGRNIYGSFPAVGLGHDSDVGRGALLPNQSVEQYGATLARWFGVPDAQLATVFPNLPNFAQRNLGFMV